MHLVQNDAFFWKGIAIGGTRLWDSSEYSFGQYVDYRENVRANTTIKETLDTEQERIFQRELIRLETSLKILDAKALPGQRRIAMTHYPPIGADLLPSRAAALLEKYKIEICVFGHLHNLKPNSTPFGVRNGIHYILTACDAVDFRPVKLVP